MFSLRFGSARPFIGFRDYDDNAASTLQLGITTYKPTESGDEEYQTTYLEWGGRSDHLTDALVAMSGVETETRLVSTADNTERRYVASNERNGLTAASLQTVEVEA